MLPLNLKKPPVVRLPPKSGFEVALSRGAQISLIVLGLLGLVFALHAGKYVLAPVGLAIIVGLMLGPLATRLERLGMSSWLSSAVVFLLFIFAVCALALPELSYEAWSGLFSNGLFKFLSFLFFLFSLGGAVFGMGEETIPFMLLLVPLLVRLGYDAITAVLVCFVATQVGFATSWMNPFSVAIAQGIAGVPPLSGAGFRIAMWAGFTSLGAAYVTWYAARVRARPERSLSFASDAWFRQGGGGAVVDDGARFSAADRT